MASKYDQPKQPPSEKNDDRHYCYSKDSEDQQFLASDYSSPSRNRIATRSGGGGESLLRASIGPYDVLCGRGASSTTNPGNIFFRRMVQDQRANYKLTKTLKEKSCIARNIVHQIYAKKGLFLRKVEDETGGTKEAKSSSLYVEVEYPRSVAKTKQALREPCRRDQQRQRKKIQETQQEYASTKRAPQHQQCVVATTKSVRSRPTDDGDDGGRREAQSLSLYNYYESGIEASSSIGYNSKEKDTSRPADQPQPSLGNFAPNFAAAPPRTISRTHPPWEYGLPYSCSYGVNNDHTKESGYNIGGDHTTSQRTKPFHRDGQLGKESSRGAHQIHHADIPPSGTCGDNTAREEPGGLLLRSLLLVSSSLPIRHAPENSRQETRIDMLLANSLRPHQQQQHLQCHHVASSRDETTTKHQCNATAVPLVVPAVAPLAPSSYPTYYTTLANLEAVRSSILPFLSSHHQQAALLLEQQRSQIVPKLQLNGQLMQQEQSFLTSRTGTVVRTDTSSNQSFTGLGLQQQQQQQHPPQQEHGIPRSLLIPGISDRSTTLGARREDLSSLIDSLLRQQHNSYNNHEMLASIAAYRRGQHQHQHQELQQHDQQQEPIVQQREQHHQQLLHQQHQQH